VSDCTWCQNLSNVTHQGTRKMCQIRLDRFWHHVQSDTFPGPLVCQIRQVLTSCTIWHISNLTHQGTRKMCQIVHDDRICLIWHTKGPGKNLTPFPGPLVCQIRQVLTSCTIWHIFLVPWCVRLDRFWHHVQSDPFYWYDVRTCLVGHTKGPRKCVWLYMMSEPV
jgi:hypothetical protein